MKLTLIFLSVCLAVSLGQNHYWPFRSQSFYQPSYYDRDNLVDSSFRGDSIEQRTNDDQLPVNYIDPQLFDSPELRRPRPQFRQEDYPMPFPRSGLGLLGNRFNSNNDRQRFLFRPFEYYATTRVTSYLVTSTITTASITSCIPVTQFSVMSGTPNITLTQTCPSKKKRTISEQFEEPILPSPVNNVIPSAVQELVPADRQSRNMALMSSKEDSEPSHIEQDDVSRQKRFFFNIVHTITVTIPTSYSFTWTSLKATVTRGVSGGLICLPSSYVVC